jgi:hypothetical protein
MNEKDSIMRRFAVLALAALSFTACGGGDGVAATATEGDTFCKLAEAASVDNDALDTVDSSDPAAVRLGLGAAIDSLSAAVAKAPKDISKTAKELLAKEEELERLLQANDYDFDKMSVTDEGKALIDDASNEVLGAEFEKYLSDKCGIATSDTTSSDTVPTDTVASDDTTLESLDLGEGEDAINTFLDYYELGTGAVLTDDERSCLVSELVDTVTGAELAEAIAGEASDELTQALGQAFVDCHVAVG